MCIALAPVRPPQWISGPAAGVEEAKSPIPAVVNAIYHATGVRVDELPVTPELILGGLDARAAAARG